MQWSDFFSALAIMFILEGILPFISPDKTREWLEQLGKLGNSSLRLSGIISMVFGLVILYLVRGYG